MFEHRNFARVRSLLRKAAPALCCIAGLLYPLAGIILFIVFRVRRSDRALMWAPLLGAILSLAIYTVDFITAVVMQV